MKIIVQSDDLGITEAVSCGIEKGIRDGVVTCTGLFSNMPAAEFALRLVKPYSHVCLGQDINLVAGRPCADPGQIPSLVQEDGSFKTSGMHRAIDAEDGSQDHVVYEECVTETEAQIRRFMELAGKKPEYLHGHSYSTPATWRAMAVMGEKYGIPLVRDMIERYGLEQEALPSGGTDEHGSHGVYTERQGISDPLHRVHRDSLRVCGPGAVSGVYLYPDPQQGLIHGHRRQNEAVDPGK